MTRIDFDASPFGPAATAEVPAGERLMDACDAVDAPVPFSCRDARCGTCLIEVLKGAELLDTPASEERLVLDALGRPATDNPTRYRLACQARITANGVIRLQLAEPEYSSRSAATREA